ncbi:MAG TPA: hypothetical protein VF455_00535 [Chryseobacterium sp.]
METKTGNSFLSNLIEFFSVLFRTKEKPMPKRPPLPESISENFRKKSELINKMHLIKILIEDDETAKKNLYEEEREYIATLKDYSKEQLQEERIKLEKKMYTIPPF